MTGSILRFFGIAISTIGTLTAFLESGPLPAVFVLIGGLIVTGLGKLIETVRRIEAKLLGSDRRLNERIGEAERYWFRWTNHDDAVTKLGESRLVKLDDRIYIEAVLLKPYATVMADYVYFRLPNREELVFERQKHYMKNANLFVFDEDLFVSLEALGVSYTIEGNVVWLS